MSRVYENIKANRVAISNINTDTIQSGTASVKVQLSSSNTQLTLAATSTSNATVSMLDASTEIVGLANAQTLSNKTLTAPVMSSYTNSGIVTIPTSGTLVTPSATQTLTNKTLSNPVMQSNASNFAYGRLVLSSTTSLTSTNTTGVGNTSMFLANVFTDCTGIGSTVLLSGILNNTAIGRSINGSASSGARPENHTFIGRLINGNTNSTISRGTAISANLAATRGYSNSVLIGSDGCNHQGLIGNSTVIIGNRCGSSAAIAGTGHFNTVYVGTNIGTTIQNTTAASTPHAALGHNSQAGIISAGVENISLGANSGARFSPIQDSQAIAIGSNAKVYFYNVSIGYNNSTTAADSDDNVSGTIIGESADSGADIMNFAIGAGGTRLMHKLYADLNTMIVSADTTLTASRTLAILGSTSGSVTLRANPTTSYTLELPDAAPVANQALTSVGWKTLTTQPYLIVTVTASYSVAVNTGVVNCDNTVAITVTLPVANAAAGRTVHVARVNTGAVTVETAGSDLLNNGSDTTFGIVAQWDTARFISDGVSRWARF